MKKRNDLQMSPFISDIGIIPDKVLTAAETLRTWAEENNVGSRWVIAGVCSRTYFDRVQEMAMQLEDIRKTTEELVRRSRADYVP